MSWHYLQGQEEASWAENSLDGAPSALSRLMPTPAPSCLPDNATGIFPGSRSGMTSVPSTAAHGAEPSTSSAEGSRAKTSRRRGKVPASKESARDSGLSSLASLARYDRNTCLWKTPQCSLVEGLGVFSETWPHWGMMLDGECFPLAPLVLHTCDDDCSLWPTPRAIMGKSGFAMGAPGKGRYRKTVIDRCAQIGWTPSGEMQEAVQGWPIGWTDCEPLETDKFRQWFDLHGRC
jgi:hypothetical protein